MITKQKDKSEKNQLTLYEKIEQAQFPNCNLAQHKDQPMNLLYKNDLNIYEPLCQKCQEESPHLYKYQRVLNLKQSLHSLNDQIHQESYSYKKSQTKDNSEEKNIEELQLISQTIKEMQFRISHINKNIQLMQMDLQQNEKLVQQDYNDIQNIIDLICIQRSEKGMRQQMEKLSKVSHLKENKQIIINKKTNVKSLTDRDNYSRYIVRMNTYLNNIKGIIENIENDTRPIVPSKLLQQINKEQSQMTNSNSMKHVTYSTQQPSTHAGQSISSPHNSKYSNALTFSVKSETAKQNHQQTHSKYQSSERKNQQNPQYYYPSHNQQMLQSGVGLSKFQSSKFTHQLGETFDSNMSYNNSVQEQTNYDQNDFIVQPNLYDTFQKTKNLQKNVENGPLNNQSFREKYYPQTVNQKSNKANNGQYLSNSNIFIQQQQLNQQQERLLGSPSLKHIITKEEQMELRKKQTDRFFEKRHEHKCDYINKYAPDTDNARKKEEEEKQKQLLKQKQIEEIHTKQVQQLNKQLKQYTKEYDELEKITKTKRKKAKNFDIREFQTFIDNEIKRVNEETERKQEQLKRELITYYNNQPKLKIIKATQQALEDERIQYIIKMQGHLQDKQNENSNQGQEFIEQSSALIKDCEKRKKELLPKIKELEERIEFYGKKLKTGKMLVPF